MGRRRLAWVTIAIGMLTIISPFVLTPRSLFARNDMVITGCVIAATALFELTRQRRVALANYLPTINIVAGVWLFISTTWLTGNALVWNNIVLGVLTIITALVALSYGPVQSRSVTQ